MIFFKVLLAAFVAATTVFSVGAVATTGYVLTGGFARVEVDSSEGSFSIPVPLRLADVGLAIASRALPAEALDDLHAEIGPMLPVLERVADELGRFPEGEIVRVRDGASHVLIAQRGGRFIVDVESGDGDVHVSLPRKAASRFVRKLATL
jgi:hypothetical protein